jgi:VanZ family protein
MRQVAKYACPLFVLLGLLIFQANDSRFILPIIVELVLLAALFLYCQPLRDKDNSAALTLFWFAPLALFWLLSERREGRDINSLSITVELILAGVGTSILLTSSSLKKQDFRLILAILLTWSVGYFSGSSGGADKMHPMFNFMGLTADQIIQLVIWLRKLIHVSFYGSLTWLLATYLWPRVSGRSQAVFFAVAFPLIISSCDEFRQGMMPNRQGSAYDVMLDMSAAVIVIIFLIIRNNRKSVETTN